MQDRRVLGMNPRRKLSFFQRVLEAIQVGIWMLAFCAISIAGFAALAWAVLVALDPRHQALEAMTTVVQFARIPLGVASGLSVFFAAITWDSARMRIDSFKTLADRRIIQSAKKQRFSSDREVS
jgi:hypothetical protein